jgi:hypothetical protein
MRGLLLISLLPILSLACTEKNSDEIISNFTSKAGQVERDIPGLLQSAVYQKMQKHLEKGLGLDSLENGFNEFQIRIWEVTEPFAGSLYLFKKLPNSEWSGEFYQYNYLQNHSGKMDSIVGKKSIVKPKSGWKDFINSLYKSNILILPHWQSIPGYYAIGNNEGGVAIELASKTKYRIYSYLTPSYRQKTFPQTKKITHIIELVKNEFKS